MGKHSLRPNRSRAAVAATVAGSVIATTVFPAAPAHADDVDALIEEMESVSHDATAKAEEIKELEDEITESEAKLRSANARAAEAKSQLESLRGVSDAQRKNVGDIAHSRHRIPKSDAILTTLDSGNPQEAIDRSAYLSLIHI